MLSKYINCLPIPSINCIQVALKHPRRVIVGCCAAMIDISKLVAQIYIKILIVITNPILNSRCANRIKNCVNGYIARPKVNSLANQVAVNSSSPQSSLRWNIPISRVQAATASGAASGTSAGAPVAAMQLPASQASTPSANPLPVIPALLTSFEFGPGQLPPDTYHSYLERALDKKDWSNTDLQVAAPQIFSALKKYLLNFTTEQSLTDARTKFDAFILSGQRLDPDQIKNSESLRILLLAAATLTSPMIPISKDASSTQFDSWYASLVRSQKDQISNQLITLMAKLDIWKRSSLDLKTGFVAFPNYILYAITVAYHKSSASPAIGAPAIAGPQASPSAPSTQQYDPQRTSAGIVHLKLATTRSTALTVACPLEGDDCGSFVDFVFSELEGRQLIPAGIGKDKIRLNGTHISTRVGDKINSANVSSIKNGTIIITFASSVSAPLTTPMVSAGAASGSAGAGVALTPYNPLGGTVDYYKTLVGGTLSFSRPVVNNSVDSFLQFIHQKLKDDGFMTATSSVGDIRLISAGRQLQFNLGGAITQAHIDLLSLGTIHIVVSAGSVGAARVFSAGAGAASGSGYVGESELKRIWGASSSLGPDPYKEIIDRLNDIIVGKPGALFDFIAAGVALPSGSVLAHYKSKYELISRDSSKVEQMAKMSKDFRQMRMNLIFDAFTRCVRNLLKDQIKDDTGHTSTHLIDKTLAELFASRFTTVTFADLKKDSVVRPHMTSDGGITVYHGSPQARRMKQDYDSHKENVLDPDYKGVNYKYLHGKGVYTGTMGVAKGYAQRGADSESLELVLKLKDDTNILVSNEQGSHRALIDAISMLAVKFFSDNCMFRGSGFYEYCLDVMGSVDIQPCHIANHFITSILEEKLKIKAVLIKNFESRGRHEFALLSFVGTTPLPAEPREKLEIRNVVRL